MYLFVYGTLMSGLGANRLLEAGNYQGTAMVKGTLYDLGLFPGLLLSSKDPTHVVKGELYKIHADMLDRLDAYEGYREGDPDSLYIRKEVWICAQDGSSLRGFTYEINRSVHPAQTIPSGCWRTHVARGGLKYHDKTGVQEGKRVEGGGHNLQLEGPMESRSGSLQ